MTELQNSLHSMGVAQYLLAVVFLICYSLVLGDFLGSGARRRVAAVGLVSATGFTALADYWVHGVLLTVFVVLGMGLFIGLAWLLKALVSACQRSIERRVLAARQRSAQDAASAAPKDPEGFAPGYMLSEERPAMDQAQG